MNFAYFWPDTGWIEAKDADQLYAKFVEQAVFTDELGYDQVWIAYSHCGRQLSRPLTSESAGPDTISHTTTNPQKSALICTEMVS